MTVKQYADVKKSPLYATIAPSLSAKDRKEFARMLEIARDGYVGERQHFDLSQASVANAFVWGGTPQGHSYWSELAERLDAAGVPGGWM